MSTLFRHLAYGLEAGLPMTAALSAATQSVSHPRLRALVKDCSEGVMAGNALYLALGRTPTLVPPAFVQVVRVGELTASLPKALQSVAETIEQRAELQRKVRGAMIYPAMVLLMGSGVTMVFLTAVVPQIAGLLDSTGQQMPLLTRSILGVSNLLRQNAAVVGAVAAVLIALPMFVGDQKCWQQMRESAVRLVPVINRLSLLASNASSARTLAMLLHSGVPLLSGLSVCADSAPTSGLRDVWRRAEDALRRGQRLTTVVGGPAVHPLFVQAIATGEATGTLTEAVTHIAGVFDREASHVASRLSTMLEPLLTVGTGVMLGGLMLAMYLPLLQLINTLR